jgi:ABC-type Zn uptake system ZnuABC Zn-binding protein ZnuA
MQNLKVRLCAAAFAALAAPTLLAAAPLRVFATTPELAMLAREVGGDAVEVRAFATGREDPHFVDPRPTFVRDLSRADVFIENGMELEVGWAPVLLNQARNPRLRAGQPGRIDASAAITPRNRPTGPVDRSMGDVHGQGSPHYLSDPSAGLLVARLLAARFAALDPEHAAQYNERYRNFSVRLSQALYGPAIANHYQSELDKLALLLHRRGLGGFVAFLQSEGRLAALGGWLGAVLPYRGVKAVGDHNAAWAYFAAVYGVEMVYNLEPIAGVVPSTAHLRTLIERMQAERVRLIFSSAYYEPRYAEFVARETGAAILPLANQGGARPGTDDYKSYMEYNIRTLVEGLKNAR